MVRFTCFLAPINHHRSKKVVESSIAQEKSRDQAVEESFCHDNNLSNTSAEQVTNASSHEGCWESEDLNGNSCPDDSEEFLHMGRLKKSQSLGSVLDKRRGFSGDDVSEDDAMDQGLSSDYSQEIDGKGLGDSFDNTGSAEVDDHGDPAANTRYRHQENHDYLISVRVLKKLDEEQHDDVGEHSSDRVVDSLHSSSNTLPILPKSRSATNLRVDTGNSIEDALAHESTRLRSRSFKDLSSLNGGRYGSLKGDNALYSEVTFQRHIALPYSHYTPKASDVDGEDSPSHADSVEECHLSNPSDEFNELAHQERGSKYSSGKFVCANQSVDGRMPHNYDGLVNEWREPEIDGVKVKENLQLDSIQYWNELTSIEFNIKRIEQWIDQIDIKNAIVEEPGESSRSVSKKDPQVVAGMTTTKHDANSLGIEVAYNYISSLNATSSSAQMSNLGLVVVPFLGAFINLRLLNLSGNALVRITAGALPRGLHMLNLSKNNISTIEGLRDLTRLRVLDLSYNRIVRIGHGLASCSSLKELYLSGNKISEVEGLHRLLKLNVLDLRLNKISTAKGLGQLAANYGSLHAINLEGNPAQRHVGDEQLKKYLLSLLPHLVYYNKQTIRASCSKEVTDRPPRSVASHQFDRGTRMEQSHTRRGTRGSNPCRPSPSKHGRPNPAVSPLLKRSKNQHVRFPPAGIIASNHLRDISAKQPSLKPK